MPPIEPPEIDIPAPGSPKSLSRNNLATWVIGVLAAVASFMFGQNKSLQAEITGIYKDRVIKLEQTNDQINAQLRDAQAKLNNCEYAKENMLQQYSISGGKKTMIITPTTEAQNANYEN